MKITTDTPGAEITVEGSGVNTFISLSLSAIRYCASVMLRPTPARRLATLTDAALPAVFTCFVIPTDTMRIATARPGAYHLRIGVHTVVVSASSLNALKAEVARLNRVPNNPPAPAPVAETTFKVGDRVRILADSRHCIASAACRDVMEVIHDPSSSTDGQFQFVLSSRGNKEGDVFASPATVRSLRDALNGVLNLAASAPLPEVPNASLATRRMMTDAAIARVEALLRDTFDLGLDNRAAFRRVLAKMREQHGTPPVDVASYSSPCPPGYETLTGFLARTGKHRALAERDLLKDGFALMRRTAGDSGPKVWVEAPQAVKSMHSDVKNVRAWPVAELERFYVDAT
jgi:hypothetical protein